jgi:hypothetical protein
LEGAAVEFTAAGGGVTVWLGWGGVDGGSTLAGGGLTEGAGVEIATLLSGFSFSAGLNATMRSATASGNASAAVGMAKINQFGLSPSGVDAIGSRSSVSRAHSRHNVIPLFTPDEDEGVIP